MRRIACISCRCELEEITIAGGGRAVLICVTCETIGHAHEIVHGSRHATVSQERMRPAAARRRATSARR